MCLLCSLLAVCGHIPAPCGPPDLAMHNLSCSYIMQTARRAAVSANTKPMWVCGVVEGSLKGLRRED